MEAEKKAEELRHSHGPAVSAADRSPERKKSGRGRKREENRPAQGSSGFPGGPPGGAAAAEGAAEPGRLPAQFPAGTPEELRRLPGRGPGDPAARGRPRESTRTAFAVWWRTSSRPIPSMRAWSSRSWERSSSISSSRTMKKASRPSST